jgi:IS4 transposase
MKAGYVLRINSRGFHLVNEKNEEIDLKQRLSRLKEGETADIWGKCRINGRYEQIRICALRKDARSERAGLKKIKKTNQRKHGGKAATEEQRENNKYIMAATSLGKEASAAQVLELYRLRWQVETAFKRLKSLFQYNDLPAKNSGSVLAWFYSKLLLAALCETMVNTGRFSPSGGTGRRA